MAMCLDQAGDQKLSGRFEYAKTSIEADFALDARADYYAVLDDHGSARDDLVTGTIDQRRPLNHESRSGLVM
jgi:hypothetical protein